MKEKSPHALRHVEFSLGHEVEIQSLAKGDVFLREGTPHMLLSSSFDEESYSIPIVNLITGAYWHIPASTKVWPCFDVTLHFKTRRRD